MIVGKVFLFKWQEFKLKSVNCLSKCRPASSAWAGREVIASSSFEGKLQLTLTLEKPSQIKARRLLIFQVEAIYQLRLINSEK
ncbi:hypothetical protein ATY35_19025 [Vibrio cidicii]|uniref:Uncharacterized protein n=1 Tax=Vibrio cidicii TaxID=1763883 RepID=A0A151JE10_9VIBR|nr:hypothetical protein AUQ44_19625 [Vibrio cidicii]KYN83037.1 hypothetical protein ATY35_19025 [Vibrio cidicii]